MHNAPSLLFPMISAALFFPTGWRKSRWQVATNLSLLIVWGAIIWGVYFDWSALPDNNAAEAKLSMGEARRHILNFGIIAAMGICSYIAFFLINFRSGMSRRVA
jgi:hypothetical protein